MIGGLKPEAKRGPSMKKTVNCLRKYKIKEGVRRRERKKEKKKEGREGDRKEVRFAV